MVAYDYCQPDFYNYTRTAAICFRLSASSDVCIGTLLPQRRFLDKITVHDSCRYILKRPVSLTTCYHGKPRFSCFTEEFDSEVVGHGMTESDARQNWEAQFHRSFQELYRMLPFEMTSKQSELWRKFERFVDLTAYKNEQPVIMTLVGKIIKKSPRPLIRWLSGELEDISPNLPVPPEFVIYRIGRFFEAIVARDFQTGRIRKIIHSKLLPNFKIMNEQEATDFLTSLPSSGDLQETTF